MGNQFGPPESSSQFCDLLPRGLQVDGEPRPVVVERVAAPSTDQVDATMTQVFPGEGAGPPAEAAKVRPLHRGKALLGLSLL